MCLYEERLVCREYNEMRTGGRTTVVHALPVRWVRRDADFAGEAGGVILCLLRLSTALERTKGRVEQRLHVTVKVVRDPDFLLGLLIHCVVGNDYGSYLSGWISVIRPDMFKANVQISVPFPGNFIPVLGDPAHPDLPPTVKPKVDIPSTLALLEPPKHILRCYHLI